MRIAGLARRSPSSTVTSLLSSPLADQAPIALFGSTASEPITASDLSDRDSGSVPASFLSSTIASRALARAASLFAALSVSRAAFSALAP